MSIEIKDTENVIIVGSGPAGYTAALYSSRADLEPLIIEGFLWGGLLQQTTDVENYPGFPEGIMGPEMMQHFRDQAERFGTRFITEDATRVEFSRRTAASTASGSATRSPTRAVVLAMGAEPQKLGVPGEDELASRGVSYCATCDAAFFRDKNTIVVGGGDTAMEEATFLSKFAGEVTIVHSRDEFRASAIMLDRARETENIEFLTPYGSSASSPATNGVARQGGPEERGDGWERELEVDGAFIAIGHMPNSQLVRGPGRRRTRTATFREGGSTLTGVPGVFAAGDLVDHTYRQAVTAAGTGCMAALDAEWYLRDTPTTRGPLA